jgi:non-heme chloroperoxidase
MSTIVAPVRSAASRGPVLVMHGEDDQICPFPTTGARSVKLLKNGTLKSYPGFPHGMPTTHADQINADLLEFIKS